MTFALLLHTRTVQFSCNSGVILCLFFHSPRQSSHSHLCHTTHYHLCAAPVEGNAPAASVHYYYGNYTNNNNVTKRLNQNLKLCYNLIYRSLLRSTSTASCWGFGFAIESSTMIACALTLSAPSTTQWLAGQSSQVSQSFA